MAKTRNDVPPGGDAGGIFDKDNKPAEPVNPMAPPVEQTSPAPDAPKTTRGMHHVLKAADQVWKILNDLQPAEREWVRGFIDSQFPKSQEPK